MRIFILILAIITAQVSAAAENLSISELETILSKTRALGTTGSQSALRASGQDFPTRLDESTYSRHRAAYLPDVQVTLRQFQISIFGQQLFRLAECFGCGGEINYYDRLVYIQNDVPENIRSFVVGHEVAHFVSEVAIRQGWVRESFSKYCEPAEYADRFEDRSDRIAHGKLLGTCHAVQDVLSLLIMKSNGIAKPSIPLSFFEYLRSASIDTLNEWDQEMNLVAIGTREEITSQAVNQIWP